MDRPSAFISYSHESNQWVSAVIALADRLAEDGIDTRLDRYDDDPPEGWPRWMDRQISEADFVIVVNSRSFYEKYHGSTGPESGLGVRWESLLALQRLYEAGGTEKRVVPVIFSEDDTTYIIHPLRSYTRYQILNSVDPLAFNEVGYEGLYRQLTGQPEYRRPSLGDVRELPPKNEARPPAPEDREERSQDVREDGAEPDAHGRDAGASDEEGSGEGNVAVATGQAEVIITLDRPIESMTESERQHLKKRLAAAIDVAPSRLELRAPRRGDPPFGTGGRA